MADVDKNKLTKLYLDTILNNSNDTIYFKDLNSKFLLNSKTHQEEFGVNSPEELIGKSDFDFFEEDFAKETFEKEKEIMRTGKPILNLIERQRKKDNIIWVSSSKYPFYDEDGNIIGIWGISRDITDLKTYEKELEITNKKLEILNKELEEISVKDELSGLYNRRFFYNLLNTILSENNNLPIEKNPLSIIMIDIDKFKTINDEYGHLIGDRLIEHCSKIIKTTVGKRGVCCRYGGDEFACIILDKCKDKVRDIAEEIRLKAENTPYESEKVKVEITFSIGTSCYSELQDKTSDGIVDMADSRLYISKQNGRNRVTSTRSDKN